MPQEEYRKVYPTGESDSPFVLVCNEPQELPIRFPITGMHKICEYDGMRYRTKVINGGICLVLVTDKLDQNIHTAAVKAMQRIAKLKAEDD